jgi:hypothetical protein
MQTTTIPTQHGQPIDFPSRLLTVTQAEEAHPATKGRLRTWMVKSDCGNPDFAGLRDAVVRLGRSVYIDEPFFVAWLRSRAGAPPSPSRNPHGRAGKRLRAAA